MIHPTPTKVLLATTLQPLVVQLAGSLAHGAKLIAQFLEHEPTPQQTETFERELRVLLREVGRRIVAWVLNHVEPECPAEAPARVWWKGQVDGNQLCEIGPHRQCIPVTHLAYKGEQRSSVPR